MLCEGIYLHTLIVMAVFTDEQRLRWYYLLGWGMYFKQLDSEELGTHLFIFASLHIYILLPVLI